MNKDKEKNLVERDNYTEVFNRAISIISMRDHGREELLKKLIVKFPEISLETIESVVSRLEELQYIDDEKFARLFVKNRLNIKHKGIFYIKRELVNKGIENNIINKVVKDFEKDEKISLDSIAEKKIKILRDKDLSEEKIQEKLFRYLAGRGYPSDKIMDTLKELLYKK